MKSKGIAMMVVMSMERLRQTKMNKRLKVISTMKKETWFISKVNGLATEKLRVMTKMGII